jgi:hypothetical protein
MVMHRLLTLQIVLLVILIISSGCAGQVPSSGLFIWIDVPVNGVEIPPGQPLNIEGHASGSGGVTKVEIWINGDEVAVIEPPRVEENLAKYSMTWMPPGPGEYTIQAVALSAVGAHSQPDIRRVYVLGETVEDTPTTTLVSTATTIATVTPVASLTPTGTTTPGVDIEFWADPPQISAGGCTNIRWSVENALLVMLGSTAVQDEGYYEACLCDDQVYTLTVMHMDNSEEQRQLTVQVNGTCDTPTPTETEVPPDNTPPPAPSPYLPANGISVDCATLAGVAWDPVSDPSGIDEYQVQVGIILGGGKTSPHPNSPWQGLSATGLKVPVDCGAVYQWRVRAVDGAGNIGVWSNWSEFGVNMG